MEPLLNIYTFVIPFENTHQKICYTYSTSENTDTGSFSCLGGLLWVVFLTFVFRGSVWLSRMGSRLSRR